MVKRAQKKLAASVSVQLQRNLPPKSMSLDSALAMVDQMFNARSLNDVERICRQLIRQIPTVEAVYSPLFAVLNELGRFPELEILAQECLAQNKRSLTAMHSLSVALRKRQAHADAEKVLEKALKIEPANPRTINQMGILQKEQGKLDAALTCFNRCIAIRPGFTEPYWNRADLYTDITDAELASMRAVAKKPGLSDIGKARLNYALARAYEHRKDFAQSLAYLHEGAAYKRKTVDYDHQHELDELRMIGEIFNARQLEKKVSCCDSEAPVFICGLPRSGTTLVEQILSSHPEVVAGDELSELMKATAQVLRVSDINDKFPLWVPTFSGKNWEKIAEIYLHKTASLQSARYFTDKMLVNYKALGLIHLVFPNAKIIHCLRHPLDNIMGCFKQLFGSGLGFSYDLDELSDMYIAYRNLMDHWHSVMPGKILDVCYEDIINDFDAELKRMLTYLDLPWSDACTHFHNNARPVLTTSSIQVRQPLFKTAVGSWRRYEAQLQPYVKKLSIWM